MSTEHVNPRFAYAKSYLYQCFFLLSAIQSCPLSQAERKMLLAKLEPMTDKTNEPRDDIRVPCTGVVTQLKKQVNAKNRQKHVSPFCVPIKHDSFVFI